MGEQPGYDRIDFRCSRIRGAGRQNRERTEGIEGDGPERRIGERTSQTAEDD